MSASSRLVRPPSPTRWSARRALALLLPLLAACSEAPSCCSGAEPGPAAGALPGTSLYHLPGSWQTAAGDAITLADLRGKPTVAAMIFTHCQVACPRLVVDLQALARRLPARSAARIALFSMDPARDTPARLAEFAAAQHLDPARFSLFTADDGTVRELAAALGVRIQRLASGDFAHSNGYVVLDAEGVIMARVDGLGADPAPALRALGVD